MKEFDLGAKEPGSRGSAPGFVSGCVGASYLTEFARIPHSERTGSRVFEVTVIYRSEGRSGAGAHSPKLVPICRFICGLIYGGLACHRLSSSVAGLCARLKQKESHSFAEREKIITCCLVLLACTPVCVLPHHALIRFCRST